ncbi:hypothetical protein ACFFIX_01660 [Metabacillus herbersteinensis]|uniref:Fimbrial assembly protein n=1 Tax=Metabacillus herbersteinensis TaxID=283816 RepID=A0ABV6G943_9BACI
MLANINLLPKRDLKNQARNFLGLILAVLLLITLIMIFFQNKSIINEGKRLTEEYAVIQEKLLNSSPKDSTSTNKTSIETLQSGVAYAESISVNIVPVLDYLTEQLPDRGFLLNFHHTDAGELNVVIQFDTNREAAHYLARLKEATFIKGVKLNSLTTNEFGEKEEDGTEVPDNEIDTNTPRTNATYQILLEEDYESLLNGGEDDEHTTS